MKKVSQNELVKEFFVNNPNRDIRHPEVVDWLVSQYKERTGLVFRDPDRAIRKLSQSGFLVKVAKGIYRYDPNLVLERNLEDFTESQKQYIKERDNYKCVICGAGIKDGVEIHVDHIKPKELGGKAVVENGQVLCAKHNFQKKTFKQTETGKKMFIRLYNLAKVSNDLKTMKFCEDVLETFEKHNINGHIEWKK